MGCKPFLPELGKRGSAQDWTCSSSAEQHPVKNLSWISISLVRFPQILAVCGSVNHTSEARCVIVSTWPWAIPLYNNSFYSGLWHNSLGLIISFFLGLLCKSNFLFTCIYPFTYICLYLVHLSLIQLMRDADTHFWWARNSSLCCPILFFQLGIFLLLLMFLSFSRAILYKHVQCDPLLTSELCYDVYKTLFDGL